MRLFALVVVISACAPDGDAGATEAFSTSETSAAVTSEPIDCAAWNACLLHPDVCPSPCGCDAGAENFFDAVCSTIDGGTFLGKCVDAEDDGFSGACPFGCEQKMDGLSNLREGRCDYSKKTCNNLPCDENLPADCGTCMPADAQIDGGFCFDADRELGTDLHVRWCAFGCSKYDGCCTDKWCK